MLLLAVVVGVALGVFSMLADGIIPGRLITLLGNIAAPWAIAAFVVGFRATSVKQGALAGALALVVGVVTYYAGAAIRDYASHRDERGLDGGRARRRTGPGGVRRGDLDPSGATAGHRGRAAGGDARGRGVLPARRPQGLALDLGAETYRLIDLGVALALVVGGLVLPWVFLKDRPSRATGYVLTVAGGAFGAFLFVLLQRVIVAVV